MIKKYLQIKLIKSFEIYKATRYLSKINTFSGDNNFFKE